MMTNVDQAIVGKFTLQSFIQLKYQRFAMCDGHNYVLCFFIFIQLARCKTQFDGNYIIWCNHVNKAACKQKQRADKQYNSINL